MSLWFHRKTMKVVVPQSLEEYVNGLVGTGKHADSGEFVEEALREHQAR